MHRFSHPLVKGEDASTGTPVFGFEVNDMFIHDPSLSECGRFSVDPSETYGITAEDAKELNRLNELLTAATEAALNAGCLHIQEALGIESGDLAGMHFPGTQASAPVARALMDYLMAEYNQTV